jgi:CheY-like chemotaxis protein
VEDNPVNQKIALLQLRRLGYSADVAGDGQQAIAALRQKRYRIVLMDSQMPQMDGLTATRHIRAAQVAGDPGMPPDLRIIAMTANAMTGDRESCLAAGMDDYVAKPVRLEFLKAAIERALQSDAATETAATSLPCPT